MAKSKALSARNLHWLDQVAATLPESLRNMPFSQLVRTLREALYMTQSQLARRSEMTQSNIARIESEKWDPSLRTMRRIMAALGCRLALVPSPEKNLQTLIEERIQLAARRRIKRVSGTMAFERQLPDDKTLEGLLQAEVMRIRENPGHDLWED